MKYCYYTDGKIVVEVPRCWQREAEDCLLSILGDWEPVKIQHVRGGVVKTQMLCRTWHEWDRWQFRWLLGTLGCKFKWQEYHPDHTDGCWAQI